MMLRNGTDATDVREIYSDYIDFNVCQCPHLPKIDIAGATSDFVYMDYDAFFGYMGNFDGSNYTSLWTQSTVPWKYDGTDMTVMAGDQFLYDSTNSQRDNIVNHGHSGFTTAGGTFSGYTYSASYGKFGEDKRGETNANFLFSDGSAQGYLGTSGDLIDVKSRHSTQTGGRLKVPTAQ